MSAPRPYVPRMPRLWWLQRPNYIRYMLREITCIFIGAYIGLVIVGLYRLGQGEPAWQAYWQAMSTTPAIVFQVVALVFTLYHTVSWFALAPSTMPLWIGERKVPEIWIQLAHYLVWIVFSIVILVIAGV